MTTIQKNYSERSVQETDISEHFPTLKKYSQECQTIVEMGVRLVYSTWALLAGLEGKEKTKLISIDILHPLEQGGSLHQVVEACKESKIEFEFRKENTLENKIEEVDLLFIDTLHNYVQLSEELRRHSPMVKKYIILHDTEKCKTVGDDGERGMQEAIDEFLDINKEWKMIEYFTNCYGLTVLGRLK